jgi:copper chaperone
MKKKTVVIPDVSCNHCVATIRAEVMDIEGVKDVKGDPSTKKITFDWSEPATWEDIEAVLIDIGYPPED